MEAAKIQSNNMSITRVPLVSAPTNCDFNSHSAEEEVFKQSPLVQKKSGKAASADVSAHHHHHQNHQQQQSAELVNNFYATYNAQQPASKQQRASVSGNPKSGANESSRQSSRAASGSQSDAANKESQQQQSYQLQYQEEFNRMRERLFRLLSKVPIQVESVAASPPESGAFPGQRPSRKHDREPLLIKYYSDRSLSEILDQHFGCSLLKHNYDRGLALDAHKKLSSHNLDQQYTCSNLLSAPGSCLSEPFVCANTTDNQAIPYEQQPKYLDPTYVEWPATSHSANIGFDWQIPSYNLDALKIAFVSERSSASMNTSNNRRSSALKDGPTLCQRQAGVTGSSRRQKVVSNGRQVAASSKQQDSQQRTNVSPSMSSVVYSSSLHQELRPTFKQQNPSADAKAKYHRSSSHSSQFIRCDAFLSPHLSAASTAATAASTATASNQQNNYSANYSHTNNQSVGPPFEAHLTASHFHHPAATTDLHLYASTYQQPLVESGGSQQLLDERQPLLLSFGPPVEQSHPQVHHNHEAAARLSGGGGGGPFCQQQAGLPDNQLLVGGHYNQPGGSLELAETYYQSSGYLQSAPSDCSNLAPGSWHLCPPTNGPPLDEAQHLEQPQLHMIDQQATNGVHSENYCRERGFYGGQEGSTGYVVYATTANCQQALDGACQMVGSETFNQSGGS